MNANTSKIMAMINGKNRNDVSLDSIPKEICIQIDNAIESIFLGKSMLIWVNGGKLIDAWQCALDNLREEMFAIPNKSVRVEYLRRAVFNHRKNWKIKMNQSDERNSFANFDSGDEKQEIIEHAHALLASGTNILKHIIESDDETGRTIPKTTTNTHENTPVKSNEREMGRMRTR